MKSSLHRPWESPILHFLIRGHNSVVPAVVIGPNFGLKSLAKPTSQWVILLYWMGLLLITISSMECTCNLRWSRRKEPKKRFASVKWVKVRDSMFNYPVHITPFQKARWAYPNVSSRSGVYNAIEMHMLICLRGIWSPDTLGFI